MEPLPEELREQIPQLGEASGEEDPMVWTKLFNPLSGWRWYLIEMQQLDTDAICYFYAVGWDEELTWLNLSDLDLHAAEVGVPNQRDENFTPRRLSELKAHEGSLSARFPLGTVVATPGALAAFQDAGQGMLDFLKRHAQGDWGELDPEDVAENEASLVHGWRLLSAYSLADGTRIWIITEADRSATTLLLPQEY